MMGILGFAFSFVFVSVVKKKKSCSGHLLSDVCVSVFREKWIEFEFEHF